MKAKAFKVLFSIALFCFLAAFTHVNASAATKLQIATQPKTVAVESGEKATVKVIAKGEGLVYRWYFKDADSSKFCLTKTFTTDTYSITMTQKTSGRMVYCVVTDKSGNSVKTSVASMKLRTPLKVVTQPSSVTVKKGATANVKVSAQGTNLTYRWYYKEFGKSTYTLAKTVTGNSYSVTMTAARAGRQLYCVITDDLGNSVMTNVVSLNMQSLEIIQQPKSVLVDEGERAAAQVNVKGRSLQYTWYYKDPGSVSYKKSTACTGNTYSFIMTAAKSGRSVYCVVTDNYGNRVQTNKAYLLMDTALGPVITKQPENPVCTIGETVNMSVTADGIGLHYMWQYSTDGIQWTNLNQTGSSLSVNATETAFTRMYRCRVWDDYGYACFTESVKLMDASVLILSQPQNWVGCPSGTAYFAIGVSDSVVSCQWQYCTDKVSAWRDCGSNEVFYSTTATAERCNYSYRCVVTDAEGRTQTSDTVTLSTTEDFYIAMQPSNVTARMGQTVTFNIQAGGESVTFQWQRSDDGKTWSNFGSAKARIGQTLQKFTVGKYYRCIVTNGDGNTLTSDVVQLKWSDTGFFSEDGKKYYVKKNGLLATGVETIAGKTYLFSDSGIMRTGLVKYNGKQYYLADGGAAVTGFAYVPELCNTLYFNKDGTAATGWKEIGGKKYYFYESGARAWGVTQIGTKEYFFDQQTGAQTSGLVQVGLNDYMYFAKGAVAATTGLKTVGDELYYFAKSGSNRGVSQGGMQTVDKKTYYFDPITKIAVTGFVTEGTKTYYFGSDHIMVSNKLIKLNGKTYYFNSSGEMCYGLTKVSGNQYYFDPATGAAMGGWVKVENNWMYFNPSTYVAYTAKTKTQCFTINGTKYMFNTNAHILTGVRKEGSTHYYFHKPYEAKNGFVEVNNRKYYVYSNQKIAKGLTTISKKCYYFSSAGVMQTGWCKVGGAHYYFDEKTGAAQAGWQSIIYGGVVRRAYMDSKTFRAVTGLKTISGKRYYFGSNCWAVTGRRKVNNVYYYFDPITNAAYTGWVKNSDGTYSYYNGSNGLVKGPGKVKINGKTYEIDSVGRRKNEKSSYPKQNKLACTWGKIGGVKCYYGMNGKPVTGLCVIDGKLYYFDKNGKMKTGLQKVNNNYYYFTQSGAITGAKTVNKKIYYFSTCTGKRLSGYQEIGGVFRYYNSSGVMATGLTKDGANIYYYSTKTGARVTGFVTANSKQYYFDPTTGKAKTGHQKIDGMNYYFDLKTGERKYGLQWVGESLYYFTKDTKLDGVKKGLQVVNNKTYYFSVYNGQSMSGYREVSGKKYFFDTATYAAVSGIRRAPNGAAYFFKSTGGVKTGWQTVGSKRYYFYPTTGEMAEGLASVKDKLYYFDFSKGILRNTEVTVAGVTYKFDKNGYGTAKGSSNLAKVINTGITCFKKGYGNEGKTNDPSKLTCSQLIITMYNSVGVQLPERSGRQYEKLLQEYHVETVDSLAQAKPGDLIFFCTVNCTYEKECDFWNEIHHVGMYMGDGKIMGSYAITGDSENNGPMVKKFQANTPSSFVYAIVRLKDINK